MPPRPQLRLAAHVRACRSDGQVILLDLRRNKYLGIGGAGLPALASAVEGWPACPPERATSVVPANIDALTRPLLAQGLLTDRPAESMASPLIEEAVSSLNAEDAIQDAAVGPARLYRFLRSAATASILLRCRSLLAVANDVAARRTRLEKSARPATIDALRSAVAVYSKLRPLVFTAQDRCLHDSLALVHFLAGEGLFPRWVIGVATRPFGAHSWVQSGGIVLNDLHEHVRKYHPILVV